MFVVDCCDVFTPGLLDLVTQPLAAQDGEMKDNATQGSELYCFIILILCEALVSARTQTHMQTHSSDHQALRGRAL